MEELEEIGILLAIENVEDVRFDRVNPFVHLTNRQFMRQFRLNNETATNLIEMISPHLLQPSRASDLDCQTKVLAALKFFGSGSYQLDVGSNMFVGISQSAVSNCVSEVVAALNHEDIFNAWITFPKDQKSLTVIRRGFFNAFGFPGVVGAIDCTHIAIVLPKTNDPLYPEHIVVV